MVDGKLTADEIHALCYSNDEIAPVPIEEEGYVAMSRELFESIVEVYRLQRLVEDQADRMVREGVMRFYLL